MAKIKLNLPTGSVEEKNLLTSFKNLDKEYIVFDADSVGSMGLPIILVCKYQDNRVVKITDANEWNEVKGYLKEIISGTAKELVKLPDTVDADEVYYTQLTLPVASFEAIKKSYNIEALAQNAAPVAETPVSEAPAVETQTAEAPTDQIIAPGPDAPAITDIPVAEQPASDNVAEANPLLSEAPVASTEPATSESGIFNNQIMADEPVADMNIASEPAPVQNTLEEVAPVIEESAPTPAVEEISPAPALEETVPAAMPEEAPAVDLTPNVDNNVLTDVAPSDDLGAPVLETAEQQPAPVEEAPIIEAVPSMDSVSEPSTESIDITPTVEADNTTPEIPTFDNSSTDTSIGGNNKEAFLKACSDAFDALIKEFKNNQ